MKKAESLLEIFKQRNNNGERRKFLAGEYVILEITQRCNLNCKFCYLGNELNSAPDIPKEALYEIIDTLEELGCLSIILLGGEPLIRSDFLEIYEYIKRKGIFITILTNGTLIDQKIVKFWKKYPPHNVRVSIYATSSKSYEKIADGKNIFERIISSLDLLKSYQINFSLWSLINKLNYNELPKMVELAKRYNTKLSLRTIIRRSIRGDNLPEVFSISSKQRARIKKIKEFKNEIEGFEEKRLKNKICYGCYFISNKMELLSCDIMREKFAFDLNRVELKEAFEKRFNQKIILRCPCD